jgi:hypothetical protein
MQESENDENDNKKQNESIRKSLIATPSSNNIYFNDDMKNLIENYEKCCKKLNELGQKSQVKDEQNKFEKEIKSDLECLELKLKYLNDKCSQLGKLDKQSQMTSSAYLDKLINEYQVSLDDIYNINFFRIAEKFHLI